jgi:hypothetical protein
VAAPKKRLAEDTRPFYSVELKDAHMVHRAIAERMLPANCAPINLQAIERWAHEELKDGLTPQAESWCIENGFIIKKKEK